MKVLFVINNLSGKDGWSRYGLDIISELGNNNIDTLSVVNEISDTDLMQVKLLEKPTAYLSNPIRSIKHSFKLIRVINEFKPDLIHVVCEPYINLLLFIFSKNINIVLTIHGTYSFPPSLYNNILKKFLSYILFKFSCIKVDHIISVSDFTKNYFSNHFNLNNLKNKITTINNSVKINSIKDLTKNKNKIQTIIFVGAVKKRKGLVETIEALNLYKNNYSDKFEFIIIGKYDVKDSYYLKLVHLINSYGLENNIKFAGVVNEEKLGYYYSITDLYIMLPINDGHKFEGFGLVYLEANSYGVPCLGSANCGAQEAVLDNKTGYVVNPKDFKDVSKKIDLILNYNSIKSSDCREWAEKHDIKIKIKEIINIYKKICQKKKK